MLEIRIVNLRVLDVDDDGMLGVEDLLLLDNFFQRNDINNVLY
jgi:hypothetical protein